MCFLKNTSYSYLVWNRGAKHAKYSSFDIYIVTHGNKVIRIRERLMYFIAWASLDPYFKFCIFLSYAFICFLLQFLMSCLSFHWPCYSLLQFVNLQSSVSFTFFSIAFIFVLLHNFICICFLCYSTFLFLGQIIFANYFLTILLICSVLFLRPSEGALYTVYVCIVRSVPFHVTR